MTGVLGVNNLVSVKIPSKNQLLSFGITTQLKCPLCLNFAKAAKRISDREENFKIRLIECFELPISVNDEWVWVVKRFCSISSD